jgi:hypothetical protein
LASVSASSRKDDDDIAYYDPFQFHWQENEDVW